MYWNSYQDYLSWAIDNAKAGWNLFNKYGKEVFKNKGLLKRYNEITLWDKLYHLNALKKNGDENGTICRKRSMVFFSTPVKNRQFICVFVYAFMFDLLCCCFNV